MKTSPIVSLAGLLAATVLVPPLHAQDAVPVTPVTGESVDQVVVTAQRRQEVAQDVGIALSAFSGPQLIQQGVTRVNGLEYLAPGLEVENQFGSGQVSFSIRGLGFRDYATNNTPTVGVYLDEVNLPLPVMTQGALFDIERVEVLRGPQGTLYGRNTTGGAINLISRRPTPVFEAGITAEYARFDLFQGEGFLSGPISDAVRARLAIATAHGGAWQQSRETDAELGEEDRLSGRLLVDADLGERFELRLALHGTNDQGDGIGKQLINDFPGFALAAPAARHDGRQTSWGTDPLFAAVAGIAPDGKPFRDNQGWGGSVMALAYLDAVDITYIGAYEALDRREYNDFDALVENYASVFFESDVSVQSHELRVASTGGGPLAWIAGVYYAEEELEEVYNSGFGASFGPGFEVVRTPYSQDVETIGLFGQVDYQLTEQWTVIGGLRYEDEERDLIGLGTFLPGGAPFDVLNLATCTTPFAAATCTADLVNRSLSTDEVTWKIALEYEPREDLLVYASVNRGIKSGGFTAYNSLNPAATEPFQPEEVVAYEIGFKSDWTDETLRLNGALFYYDYENQQVQSALWVAIPPASQTLVGRIVNAPESEVYGGELELVWQVNEHLQITQALGYKHGEFERFIDADGTVPFGTIDRSGDDIGFPELSYSGAITYETRTDYGFSVTANFAYAYRDQQSFPLLNDNAVFNIDSYWLANASLSFRPDGTDWELTVFGRNIFDEDYDETRNTFVAATGDDFAVPGPPATYGIRVSFAY